MCISHAQQHSKLPSHHTADTLIVFDLIDLICKSMFMVWTWWRRRRTQQAAPSCCLSTIILHRYKPFSYNAVSNYTVGSFKCCLLASQVSLKCNCVTANSWDRQKIPHVSPQSLQHKVDSTVTHATHTQCSFMMLRWVPTGKCVCELVILTLLQWILDILNITRYPGCNATLKKWWIEQ